MPGLYLRSLAHTAHALPIKYANNRAIGALHHRLHTQRANQDCDIDLPLPRILALLLAWIVNLGLWYSISHCCTSIFVQQSLCGIYKKK